MHAETHRMMFDTWQHMQDAITDAIGDDIAVRQRIVAAGVASAALLAIAIMVRNHRAQRRFITDTRRTRCARRCMRSARSRS
jgi:hypothetical protein